ncbi:hypothetical protein [Aliarcobacter butzleri]|uniref:hypothetical protein n=1 Tax=Aliarcobacter butzleri TaxID=28197 RepID=UPI0021B2A9B5|nr:hypothetical protein [Aliarcobacter butzleri]MCT7555444.1 hypothetical protein [Aliarcobacter butzleri]
MNLKFITILIVVFIFSGCQLYYSFSNYQDVLLKNNITEEQMCYMITKNETSWISDKRKCNTEITNDIVKNLILFKQECNQINGVIKVFSEFTTCNIYNDLYIIYDEDYLIKFDEVSNIIIKSKQYKTIKEICPSFNNAVYDKQSRSCKFNNGSPFSYRLLEKLLREKDNQVYKKEQENIKNIELEWIEEAKNWKGSLDDLCENLTEYSAKNSFDKTNLNCTTFDKRKIQKYEVMKPLLVEQHKKITTKRAEEEKIRIDQIKQKWQGRIGKSSSLKRGNSYLCETPATLFMMLFVPTRIQIDVGYSNVNVDNIASLYYIDSFKDYDLYEGYSADNKYYKLKIYKSALLKTTPYSIDFSGLQYYCEIK